jgi:L-asparaginase
VRALLANGEGTVGVATAVAVLERGGKALDAIEQGIRVVERDPRIKSVGYGGHPNLLGQIECDAAVMNGRTLECGSVAALRGYVHAISVARQVMDRLPHVLLVGEGAAIFAREIGAEAADLLTPEMRDHHERWLRDHVPADVFARWPAANLVDYAWASAERLLAGGTTVYLAIDAAGDLAGGVSSSGWARKYPGRVGDSPIVGAGLYADQRYGACGCTHTGEVAVRAGTARAVVLYMKRGARVEEACLEAVDDLRALEGGYRGPLVIHALDREGRPCVVSTRDLGDRVDCDYWTESADRVARLTPRVVVP